MWKRELEGDRELQVQEQSAWKIGVVKHRWERSETNARHLF